MLLKLFHIKTHDPLLYALIKGGAFQVYKFYTLCPVPRSSFCVVKIKVNSVQTIDCI